MVKKVVLSDQESDDELNELPEVLTKQAAQQKFKTQNLNIRERQERKQPVAKKNTPVLANQDLFN